MKAITAKSIWISRAFVLVLFVLSSMLLLPFLPSVSSSPSTPIFGENVNFDGIYDWEVDLELLASSTDYITYHEFRDTICRVETSVNSCISGLGSRKIRFDTAEELYRFSIDVSFEKVYVTAEPSQNVKLSSEKISYLLSLYYVLGNDIDYSVMNAKTWAPVGYDFRDTSNVLYKNVFQGVFDGQGFTISNLYVAGYDYMIYVEEIDELNSIDIALSPYYSMFTINEGTIKNIGLINPTLELLDTHIDISKTSNLVGYNAPTGVVDHVFVIDTRTNVLDAGIRYRVGTATQSFSAAGIVHNNLGTFTNAFYSSKVVVNGSWINRFSLQPALFENTGTIGQIVYDSSVYLLNVTVGSTTFTINTPNALLQTGESTSLLKSSSSSLNTANDLWYFYQDDTYPQLLGLEFDNGYYLIENPIDLVFFSRLIGYNTIANSVSYGFAQYRLTTNIDMSIVAPGAYKTPSVNFNGLLTGYNESGTTLEDNYYIYNLNFTTGTIRGSSYYSGLFSVLAAGAIVEQLNINQSSIALSNTESFYSNIFYIGMVSGRVSGGTIQDVIVDASVNLGTQAIGQTHVGMIAGDGAGVIQRVSAKGSLNAGNHVFASNYNIAPKYYIGGVVGSAVANKLTLHEVVNNAPITGFSTSSTFNFAVNNSSILIKIGGVIGYVVYTSTANHSFTEITNRANITFGSVINTVSLPSTQSIGGVFGEISGSAAPILEVDGAFSNANYYNEGNIIGSYAAGTATIRAAGLAVLNFSVAAEFALGYNYGSYQYTTTGATQPTGTFLYTGGVYSLGSETLTLSRIYNYGDYTVSTNFYNTINPLYYSLNNQSTLIRYSINYGNVAVLNNGGATTITLASGQPLTVSGVTTSSNIDYLNVINYGNIDVVGLNIGTNQLNVSGITYQLSATRLMKNVLNEGNITVANMTGTGLIFIGGLVNRNYAGDLHINGVTKASQGILNSINYGAISTSYGLKAANLYGVKGNSNTYAAGVATLNGGSIQDAANLGNISIYNASTSGTTTIENDSNQYFAGRVGAFTAGVTAGGIAAITLSANARIFDTANNGDVVAMAYRYARAGGILAVSLYSESTAGGITTAFGLADTIQNSQLANGLNFGNISALTNLIASYTLTTNNSNQPLYYGGGTSTNINFYIGTRVATQERPGIFSSAGGVIGYGLCVMTRMLNHGTISATDVAGGIVGATYVLGGSSSPITVVNISTAINYGRIKSILNTSVMEGATPIDPYLLSITNISTFYMADNNSFIFPSNPDPLTPIWMAPGAKRGFGGIFGRLQRGTNGIMTSSGGTFDFIVNADPNIDLIGRLDQVYNFSSSSRFFRFNDAIYYSARLDDTTQAVFTGYFYAESRYISRTLSGGIYTYTMRANNVYRQVGIVSTYDSSPVINYTFRSQSSYTSTTTTYRGLYGRIPVPWITENSSDPNITNLSQQYMYHPDFPMRSNPALSEYIYYLEPDLLAPRFQTGGETPRPGGMYVLSTSFGSTFGSVLPANISDEALYPINESHDPVASLLIDYTAVPSSLLSPISQDVIDSFQALKQTIFNNKSAFLPEVSPPLVLTENNGSNTVLSNGVVDEINRTITFTISLEAYLSAQSSANYQVSTISTSARALVAKRLNDYYGGVPSQAQIDAYNDLLYPQRLAGIATGDFAPLLQVNLPDRSITTNDTRSLGYFTVYSEAFVYDDLFAQANYYTEYQVFITFTPTITNSGGGFIGINTVSFNSGANQTVVNQSDVSSLGDVNYNGSIRFNFLDELSVFTAGYDFKNYISIRYQDGTVVNPMYYTVSSIPVTINGSNRNYSITITFSNQTRFGNYYLDYRYFASSDVLSVMFDKLPSPIANVTGLQYYSSGTSVSIVGTTINSNVNLGGTLNIDGSGTSFTSSTNNSLPSYLSNTTFNVNFMTANSFVISPFATLQSATLLSTTYNSGYKTYHIEYVLISESGASTTINHYIVERVIDLTAVFKNGNEIDVSDSFALREDLLTVFQVNLGLDSTLNLYRFTPTTSTYIDIQVTGQNLAGTVTYTPQQIVGITYRTVNNNSLYIDMDATTLPGNYVFSFRIYRDGVEGVYVQLQTTLTIQKRAGVDPYLKDIRFSELANETSYPVIRITDINGTILTGTGKDPRVFFGGIDYDDADVEGYRYFRVDGQVSNISLVEYVPIMIDYLPFGATIARRAWDPVLEQWFWTTEVNAASSQNDKNTLIADFTVIPETGNEPGENEEVVILYRVTSEDGATFTYYYITVTDIVFNVTLIFDIYFCTGPTFASCTIASESANFASELVIITVKNFDTNGDSTVINVIDPQFYPTFSVINGLNNQMTQFYYTYSGMYRYSFGRNISGFYIFDLELPKDRYLNNQYDFTIEHQDFLLNDASNYIPGLTGKYFYIEAGTKNRTRRFNIYIRDHAEIQTAAPWGLFDFFRSWSNGDN